LKIAISGDSNINLVKRVHGEIREKITKKTFFESSWTEEELINIIFVRVDKIKMLCALPFLSEDFFDRMNNQCLCKTYFVCFVRLDLVVCFYLISNKPIFASLNGMIVFILQKISMKTGIQN